MKEEEEFQRYTPQYPLPVDVASMSRQDTICQFCGVSYLIHNEIKALEEKCEKLEADLAFYAGMSSREANLERLLDTERSRVADLQSTLAMNTHKFNEMTRNIELMRDQVDQAQRAHQQSKTALVNCLSDLHNAHQHLQTLRTEHSILRDQYQKDTQTWKMFLHTMQTSLEKEVETMLRKYSKQIDQNRNEIERYQHQITDMNRLMEELRNRNDQSQLQSKESHLLVQNHLEAARTEIEFRKDESARLQDKLIDEEQRRRQLQNDFDRMKENSERLERQLSIQYRTNEEIALLLNQCREDLSKEKELQSNANLELERLRHEFQQLTDDYQQLTEAHKQLENNELTSKRRSDEMNRTRQAVLDRTRDEYEKLLRKYTDLDELYRELVERRDQEMSEWTMLRKELERLHEENIELNKQRETVHITHDLQMKKLRDQYGKQFKEAEQWPDRLQAELTREREQHRMQMMDLERRLKESFFTELNIEKQKYNGLLRKYEQENDFSTEQLRHELLSTEKVTIEQRQYYTKQIEQLENDKATLKSELDQLRDVLKELHEQINRQEMSEENRTNTLQLKEELVAKETNLFQAQSIIAELRKDLEQAREEMNTLQDTVHRECTEREQLKDALIDARQQLLTLKKNGVLNGTVSRSLHTPPVAFAEIERRVPAPLPYSQAPGLPRPKMPSVSISEVNTRDNSLHGDAADQMARPMSSNYQAQYRLKTLPPIPSQTQQPAQQQSKRRPKGLSPGSSQADQLLANQRRIARFIKHIK